MATNIDNLAGKIENEGATPQGTLTADEWNQLIRATKENQGSVKKIIYNKKVLPVSADGTVEIEPISSDSRLTLTTSDNTESIVSITGKLVLHLRATSVINGSDTFENINLDIQRFNAATGWTSVGSASMSAVAESSSAYTVIDVSEFLISGDQQLRIKATGAETNLSAIVSFSSIIFTKLELEFAGEWQRACRNEMPLSFYVNGAVSKTLHIKISGETAAGAASFRNLTFSLGTATYPTTPWSTTVTDSESDACKILGIHGVHRVEAWLTCDDGNGGTLESSHTHNQIMVVADENDQTPFLMLQNVTESVQNYVQNKLLDYAVYNPEGLTEIAFIYTNYANTEEYLRAQQNVASEVAGALINTIEIDNSDQASLYAYLRVFRILPDGSESDFMLASSGSSTITVLVDNSENFSPTAGADFVLNPKTRDNSENNPARILNAAKNNAEIAGSVFTGFSFVNDGWLNDDTNNKVLRVRAGQSVVIPYECFQDFLASTANSLTIELDVALRNITNEEDPIFRICSYVAATGKPLGIEMKPLVGRFLTTTKTVDGEQDFRWQEGVRTHISFNIVHALRSEAGDNTTLSLVRIFINGVINREFMFDLAEDKEFINGSSLGIRIGQAAADGRAAAADIDVYSLRVYRKALSASDCLQDYISSLPTSAEKLAFRSANDILSADGTISYAKASGKYNCLIWHGFHTSGHSDADKNTKQGWLEISMLDAAGNYDPDHSGTICKESKSLPDKGQGTTAKTYREWNQQYDINKAKGTIIVDGETVPDGWIDGNGIYRGQFYRLMEGVPDAQKLVLKINYASSMQSHKQGATELYDMLYKLVVGPTSIQQTEGFENTRVAVIERPFLYFTQADSDSEPVFQGLGTFGPGKMDKKTWGYDKKKFPYFAMMEGSDNNMPLTDMRVPWTEETVTYNPEEEYFEYAGMGNIDFDAGVTETVEVAGKEIERPVSDTYLPFYKASWNWLFQHNCLFQPFIGTFQDFLLSKPNIRSQYWMTQSSDTVSQYDLVRYNVTGYDGDGNEIGEWVPAGMPSGIGFEKKNLQTLFPDAIPAEHSGQWEKINADFQDAMAAKAKLEFGNHFNVRSAQFHYAFVNQFLAGSDNNSKNTYYVMDPVRHIVELHADDLDTIFATDNVGWQDKPYYIERDYDDGFYEGKYNVLFDLIGRMYRVELPQMLNTIFKAMASLITAEDMAKGIDASPSGCMQKYFFAIQEYFPAVAYNETARIRYEQAQLAVNKGTFTPSRGVVPITQSLGDQLQSERQYIKRRLVYMSSYAAYGEFSQSGSNALSFQGYPNVDGSSCVMKFGVKPHQWLYPTGSRGQTLIDPHVRVAPGEVYTLNLGTVTGDTNVRVCGVNYMRSLGNMGDISVNPNYSFPLSGERLVEFVAEPSGDAQFRPSSMAITAPLMEKFSLNGSTPIGGTINLSGCTRMREIDLRGTSMTSVRLPESERLEIVRLPNKLTAITISNMPNLQTFTLDGVAFLESLILGMNIGNVNTLQIVNNCFNTKAPLTALRVEQAVWENVQPSVLEWLTNIANCQLKGSMVVAGTSTSVTFEMKRKMIAKWGDIDTGADGLKVTYPIREIVNIIASGPGAIAALGDYQYEATPATAGNTSTPYGNNFKSITWSIEPNEYATITKDGLLTVTKLGQEMEDGSGPEAIITCNVVLLNGSTLEATKVVRMYNRSAKVGDYVFADGTYSDLPDEGKTTIGQCFYIDPEDPSLRLMVGLQNFPVMPWGLYRDVNNPNNAINDIELESGYNAYDTPMNNITASGLVATSEGGKNGYISDDTYRDESGLGDKDGFRKLASNTACSLLGWYTLPRDFHGFKKGDKIPWGKYQTLEIIDHRDRVLSETGHEIPSASDGKTELQVLDDLMAAIVEEGGATKYRQFYYPMASRIYAWQPSVRSGEVLAEKFKAHKWWLPSEGELARIAWYYMNGVAGGEHGIFVESIGRGIMQDFGSSWFGASSEYYLPHNWLVNFGSGYCCGTYKYNSGLARAVAAF